MLPSLLWPHYHHLRKVLFNSKITSKIMSSSLTKTKRTKRKRKKNNEGGSREVTHSTQEPLKLSLSFSEIKQAVLF